MVIASKATTAGPNWCWSANNLDVTGLEFRESTSCICLAVTIMKVTAEAENGSRDASELCAAPDAAEKSSNTDTAAETSSLLTSPAQLPAAQRRSTCSASWSTEWWKSTFSSK